MTSPDTTDSTIAVYGEGLIDLVPNPGHTHDAALAPLQPALGGGPFNVAIAAARLGSCVHFISRLSTDAFGEALVDRLETEGVDTSDLQRGEEPTTLALTTLDDAGHASYRFINENTADRFAEPVATKASISSFGTCSLAWEPGASRYAALLSTLARRGDLIALDPNIRPSFATEQHRRRLLGLLDSVTVLKLSDEELSFFGGLDYLRSRNIPAIVLTRGASGISVYTPSLEVSVPARIVEVVDTIGAGDTTMGALLTVFARHGWGQADIAAISAHTWEKILQFVADAASVTASRHGANPPHCADLPEKR